ncbi:unnamed protein product, partial [Mesorhabditis spiculigera]
MKSLLEVLFSFFGFNLHTRTSSSLSVDWITLRCAGGHDDSTGADNVFNRQILNAAYRGTREAEAVRGGLAGEPLELAIRAGLQELATMKINVRAQNRMVVAATDAVFESLSNQFENHEANPAAQQQLQRKLKALNAELSVMMKCDNWLRQQGQVERAVVAVAAEVPPGRVLVRNIPINQGNARISSAHAMPKLQPAGLADKPSLAQTWTRELLVLRVVVRLPSDVFLFVEQVGPASTRRSRAIVPIAIGPIPFSTMPSVRFCANAVSKTSGSCFEFPHKRFPDPAKVPSSAVP